LKPINAVGNSNQRNKEKLILPALPCRDMTECLQNKDTDMTACVQNKDTDMESNSMYAKQGYRHGIQDRISREFFNTYNHARVVVENHQQGQIRV
jgi:hypothetical protein